jgi:hypothetical protein
MGTKVGVIKLDGRMSVQQRDRALSAFQGDSSYQLLLMSLKAGGVALNLTAGARIETTYRDFDGLSSAQIDGKVCYETQCFAKTGSGQT